MMKKIMCSLFLLLIATTTFSQVTTPTPSSNDYSKLAKSQTTSGIIFLLLGTGLCIAAVSSIEISFTQKPDNSTFYTLGTVGLTSAAAGTVLLLAGGRNRKKAKAISVKQGQLFLPQQEKLMTKAVPTVGLQLTF